LYRADTPFSLSFSGSGFLALYQVGVVQSLLELAPELLKSACKVYGSSAGSLIAAAVVCGIGLGKTVTVQISLLWGARETILGPLSPKCSLLANIKAVLQRMLPENSYQLASGRLHISLTRVVDGQNVMASEFSSKEELIQALLCSCFLPIYCGFIPPSYRGVRYVDGGFTGLQPVSSLEEPVITVSPFTGELDICPRDCPAIFFCFQIFNGSIQISIENLCRISYALFPPSTMVSPPALLPSLRFSSISIINQSDLTWRVQYPLFLQCIYLVDTVGGWPTWNGVHPDLTTFKGVELWLLEANLCLLPSTWATPTLHGWTESASAWMESSLVTSSVSPCRS
uniref:PNPLA domain-containing protein n=1 Tax=Strigops habroptila TaxID=2489341 RepID=A0A672UYV9_STRHB